MTNQKFVKTRPPTKRKYITDDQALDALALAPPMIRAYVPLKLMIDLRMTDMLLQRRSDRKEDGSHCTPEKTALTSNKSLIFSRTPELEELVESLREKGKIHTWLFHTFEGRCYVGMNKKASGFNSAWQHWMKKVKNAGLETFTERQLRVKAGSDAESDQQAADVLAHTTTATTKKHYRAKPNDVKPLKTAINRK